MIQPEPDHDEHVKKNEERDTDVMESSTSGGVHEPTTDHAKNHNHPVTTTKRRGKVALGVLVVVVLLGVTVWHVVYNAPNLESKLRTVLVQNIPFPVAMVNGKNILLRDFEKNVASAQFFLDQQGAQLYGGQLPSSEQLRQNEMDRLVNMRLKQQLAAERGVTVTTDDINTFFDSEILPQAPGGMAEVEETLRTLYDWSVDDFKKNILEEVVLDKKLQESIQADEAAVNAVRDRAQALRDEIVNSDKPFSDFASENSDDTASAVEGGMLGYFARGTMVPEFEEAAFALEVGAVSEIVKTQYGYHIIKVTNKDTEGDRVEARHILLAFPTASSLAKERRESATIRTLLPRYADTDKEVAPTTEEIPTNINTTPAAEPTTDASASTPDNTTENTNAAE